MNKKINTKCVHSGKKIEKATGGLTTPIYTSTSHLFPYNNSEPRYPRYMNMPNYESVSEKIAALENSKYGMVFASGMAAITSAIMVNLKQGDHAVIQSQIYGGTYNFLVREIERYGIEISFVQSTKIENFADAIKSNTKVIYIETPSNPLLEVIDIEAIAKLAKANNLVSIIDNTFASPVNQNPTDFGIDLSVHSGTKYLGGHSDLLCGAITTNSEELINKIYKYAMNHGGTLSTDSCYKLERSLMTLGLRMQRQTENAMEIAKYLDNLPQISRVYYPGLASHQGHEIAKKQMSGFGAMLSFELDKDIETCHKFMHSLKICAAATSLGGIESTISMPCEMSHAKMTKEEREKNGIKENLFRLSVGIEDVGDLIEDFEKAVS